MAGDKRYVEEAVKAAVAEIEAAKSQPVVLPELVNSGDWTVKEHQEMMGLTHLINKEMYVPFGDSTLEASVRLHELAHAKWTDLEMHKHLHSPLGEYLQVVEDMRIHHLLGETVGHWDLYGNAMLEYVREGYSSDAYRTDRENTVLLEIAARQNNSGPVLPLSAEDRAFVDLVQDEIKSDPSPAKAVEMAQFVSDYLNGEGQFAGPEEEPNPGTEGGGGQSTSGDDEDEEGDDSSSSNGDEGDSTEPSKAQATPTWKPPKMPFIQPLQRGGTLGGFPRSGRGYSWGRMTVEAPPLTVGVNRSKVQRRARKNLKEGTVPRKIERILTDRKVFQKKAKRQKAGGTVLVDTSGSMNLEIGDVERMVERTKHGTVAAYRGRETFGKLVILAKNWMRVSDLYSVLPSDWYNNIVDGPAIRWLATQPEPRVWISDQVITGIKPNAYPTFDVELWREVDALCKMYKIARYDTIEDYFDGVESTATEADIRSRADS